MSNKEDDQQTTRGDNAGSNRADGGAGAPTGMGQGGAQGNPSGPRDANDPGSTRYGKSGAGSTNQSKEDEKKEQGGWTSRQGGDQSSGPGAKDER